MSTEPRRRSAATQWYATLVVRGRWVVLVAMVAAVWGAVSFLPTLAATGGKLSGLIGSASNISTRVEIVQRFGFPLLSHTAVVQRDAQGLAPSVLKQATRHALRVDINTVLGQSEDDLLFAVPVPNSPRVFPGPNDEITTLVTYLFVDPSLSASGQYQVAKQYASRIDSPGEVLLGVSGTIPLRVEQVRLVQDHLLWVEIGAVLAVALIVGFAFRSIVAPLITLVTAGAGYILAVRVVAAGAELIGRSVPTLLGPLLVALLLGITTDYSIFFLTGYKRRLLAGQDSRSAARGAVREYLPIVLVAGLVVAAGVLSLLVAQTNVFSSFGPGLAVTVLVALIVSMLMVPALMAVLGRWAFWPVRFPPGPEHADPDQESSQDSSARRTPRWARIFAHRGMAAVVAVVVAGLLIAAMSPLLRMRESVLPMTSLPEGNSVLNAWKGAAKGFAPGILSPTEVIVTGDGIAERTRALERLNRQLADQPGVAAVFGPGEFPVPRPLRQQINLFTAPGGDAVRFLVVFDADPLAALATEYLAEIQQRMPELLDTAGLDQADVAYAGDTVIALHLVKSARGDYVRVAVTIALISLVLLMLFLRAVVAPLYLVVCSFLALGASLGMMVLIFQLSADTASGVIFFVPFAVGVLLVSLGADYLIFMVGDIWDVARTRPLSEALTIAVPRSTGAISAAGVTLAACFAVVAFVPLISFWELAFAMAAGVLIDTFVVRALLVPALISVVGKASGWPRSRLRTEGELNKYQRR